MATHVETLAAWAAGLELESIPKAVDVRCRLQVLHILTQIQPTPQDKTLRSTGPTRGPAPLVGGGTSSPVHAARLHAARAAVPDKLDFVLGGATGVGAVAAALACAKGATLGRLIEAIVAGNEVGGRVGAAMMLGPHHGLGNGWVYASSAAASAAKMMNLSPTQTAHALAIALVGAGPIPRSVLASAGRPLAIGLAVARGVEAAQLARKGVAGKTDVLEQAGGLMEAGCWVPLSHAYTGLGTAWLTETVSFPRWPGPVAWHSVLDGVHEVLSRHLKAADKRIRADQILAITVRVPAPAVALDQWIVRHGLPDRLGLGHSIRHAIGALVVHHELSVPALDPDPRCGLVAGRVRIEHDISLTMDLMTHALDTVLPLLGGLTEGEIRSLFNRMGGANSIWPRMKWSDARTFAEQRPDRWLERIRYAPRSLSDARISAWQWRFGAHVEVKTSRGGRWPTSVPVASGGPGSSWDPLRSRVVEAFAQDDEGSEADAWAVLDMSAEVGTADVLKHLFG